MKTYKFEQDYYTQQISVGDTVSVNGNRILIVNILKVDFADKIVWFSGVVESELE